MTIDKAFNASTSYYDDWMQKALPGYTDLFNAAVDCIPFSAEKPIRVLDLGAGTGLFSQHVLTVYARARFVLIDVADKMLDVARERFQNSPEHFEYEVSDYRNLMEQNKYDLVISSLSIHHLLDAEKRNLFHAIYSALKQPGVFINVDQIRGETQEIRDLYWHHWMNHVRQAGATEDQIQSSINRRTEYDKDALLADQIAWLKEARFANVDCVYKNYFVGVFQGNKGKFPASSTQEDK